MRANGRGPVAEQQPTFIFDRNNGLTVIRTYRGLHHGAIAHARQLRQLTGADRVIVQPEGDTPISTVRAEYGFPPETSEEEVATETWQLLAEEISFDPRSNPDVREFPLERIDEIDKKLSSEDPASVTLSTVPITTSSGKQISEQDVYELLRRGVQGYLTYHFVLDVTRTVSQNFTGSIAAFNASAPTAALRVSFADIEKVYTDTDLKNEQQPPASIVFSIDSLPPTAPVAGQEIGGWFKKPPIVTQAARNRVDIRQQFIRGHFSDVLYSFK